MHFELEITEAQYPNTSMMTTHDWSGEHRTSGKRWKAPEKLSEEFHVYGAEWTADEVIWYFDGREVRRIQHDYCRAPSPVRLSSAVGRFAGIISDTLDGTMQEVDWVRVYKKREDTVAAQSSSD